MSKNPGYVPHLSEKSSGRDINHGHVLTDFFAATPDTGSLSRRSVQLSTTVVPQLDNTRSSGQALPAGSAYTWTGDLNVPVAGRYWISLGLLGAGGSISLDGTQLVIGGLSAQPERAWSLSSAEGWTIEGRQHGEITRPQAPGAPSG